MFICFHMLSWTNLNIHVEHIIIVSNIYIIKKIDIKIVYIRS